MRARSFGRLYVVLAWQPAGAPLVDRCTTYEKRRPLGGPLRRGRGVLIRLPFAGHRPTIGLVIGIWEPTRGR